MVGLCWRMWFNTVECSYESRFYTDSSSKVITCHIVRDDPNKNSVTD